MGLPKINITFQTLAATLIARSQKGIVALILLDDALTTKDQFVYNSIDEVTDAWTADNLKSISLCFDGTPRKVYVQRIGATAPTLNTALSALGNRKWNYLAVPSATTEQQSTIASWLKSKRNVDKKTYKYVVGGLTSDDMGIINFDSDNVLVGTKTYSKTEFTPRIAGQIAGLPIDRSLTYQAFSDVTGFDELLDDDARSTAIDAGKLIFINDGEKIKIARGINSLTTTTATQGAVFKKIRIVEIVDMIRDDLTDTIRDNYIGKWLNTYQNKLLLIGAINAYLSELQVESTLDPNYKNLCKIDVTQQTIYLKGLGVATDDMTTAEIEQYNTNDQVFLQLNIKPVDSMEDFSIAVYL